MFYFLALEEEINEYFKRLNVFTEGDCSTSKE